MSIRADSIIAKMNNVLDPCYIIWQRHQTQSEIKFRDYIERFSFSDKFLCSDDAEIQIISWLRIAHFFPIG